MKIDPALTSPNYIRLLKPSKVKSGSSIGSLLRSTKNVVVDYGGKGVNIFKQLAISFFGLAGLICGGLMASFFKDNTAADWGSKFLMIAGGALSVFGLVDLSKMFKEQTKQIAKNGKHIHEKVSERLGTACINAESALTSANPRLGSEPLTSKSGLLYLNETSGNNIRAQVISLLSTYTDPELKAWVNNYVSGVEPSLTNISKKVVSRSEFKDRLALLLGNAISSRMDDSDLQINDFSDILRTDQLILSAPADNATKEKVEIVNMLPNDFAFVFNFARYYAIKHLRKNDSLNGIIGDENDITILKKIAEQGGAKQGVESDLKEHASNYLNQLQNAENYLIVLRDVINYVLNNASSTDEKVTRNVVILRQALICGFKIKAKDINDVDQYLKSVKNGNEENTYIYASLDAKLNDINTYTKENLKDVIGNNENSTFRREYSSVDEEVEFLQGTKLVEYLVR